jgi:isocitrate lyase
MSTKEQQIAELEKDWAENPRWKGIKRGYSRGRCRTPAWFVPDRIHRCPSRRRKAVGSGQQRALRQLPRRADRRSGDAAGQGGGQGDLPVGLAGAADNNSYAAMYPDQSLYPVDSVPKVVERINNSSSRADEIQCSKDVNAGDKGYIDYFAPIVADAEAGFGGVLNAFELMKNMIAPAPPACISKTSWLRSRSAATWVARCWCRRRKPYRS